MKINFTFERYWASPCGDMQGVRCEAGLMMSTLQPCTKRVSALSDIARTNTPISGAHVWFVSYFSFIIHICLVRNSSVSENFSLIRR